MDRPGQRPLRPLPPPTMPSGTPPAVDDASDAGVAGPSGTPTPTSPTFTSARVGSLTATWRIVLGLAWGAGFFAYAAVWQASVQLGIGTWWVGPRADPTPTLLRLVPFLACLGMVLGVVYGVRRLPTAGIALGVGLVAFAVPDLSRSTSLAITELLIGSLLLTVSALARTGLVRPVATTPPSPGEPSAAGR